MKTSFILSAFVGWTLAQYDVYSAPFRLVLTSDDPELNNTALGACHQGAALEGLCPTNQTTSSPPTPYTTFHHATESTSPSPHDTPGILYYNLTLAGNRVIRSALALSHSPTTNIAIPIFSPGNASFTPLSIARACEDLYIPRYQDDTVSPPKWLSEPERISNWWVCLTRWAYEYQTLVWSVGVRDVPQNPSCRKVRVRRVFV